MSAGVAPNSGSIFRMVVLGELHVWATPMVKLVKTFTDMGEPPESMDDLKKKVEALTNERLKILSGRGCVFQYAYMSKETVLYIPTGWFVLERASESSCPLLYGVRKSYFMKTAAGLENYKQCKAMLAACGLSVHKMDKVVDLFEAK